MGLVDDEDRVAWRAEANCKGLPVDWFFPDKPVTMPPAAAELCGACPVRLDCLVDATFHDEPFGIWGGATPAQRDRLRKITRTNYRHAFSMNAVREVCEEELAAGLPEARSVGRPRIQNVIDMRSRRRSA